MHYNLIKPDKTLSAFVERFWLLHNNSNLDQEVIVIPDGRIDLIFTTSPDEPFRAAIIGIETSPSQHTFSAHTILFGVSLKLLSVEYLMDTTISNLVNGLQLLPAGFWEITETDLTNFEMFCQKVSDKISSCLNTTVDTRKAKLFDLLYFSNGTITVKEVAETVYWSSRQINRYFNNKFGISLKKFCTILRFKASFQQIKEGKLFPELAFADQAHFIKEVKKLTGVKPKELFKNQNDRFVQFSTLTKI